MWPSLKPVDFLSARKFASRSHPGVTFWIRRVSLQQRIELLERVAELAAQDEFLRAGETAADQVGAALISTRVAKLLVEWGLVRLEGLSIDGVPATASLLVEQGPEELCGEIVEAVQASLGLNEEERKNS